MKSGDMKTTLAPERWTTTSCVFGISSNKYPLAPLTSGRFTVPVTNSRRSDPGCRVLTPSRQLSSSPSSHGRWSRRERKNMEYEFLAEDGKRYMESDAAPHSTPRWVTTSLSYIIVTV